MLNSLNRRTRVLLGMVFCLMLVRFVMVPLIDWQNSQLAASRELATRINKAERLVSSGQAEQTGVVLTDQIKKLKARYFVGLSELDLQLQLDKAIDDSLSTFNLRQERRSWRFDDAKYLTGEVRISVVGNWLGLVKWVHFLENQQKFAGISEFRAVPSRAGKNNEVTAYLVIRYRVLKDNV